MSAFLVIARRELAGFFYAPIAYVVGVAFLALNGLSFWALMKALSDPQVPAVPGAVLRDFFGGTMLHWLIVFALVALLSMRSVAEERRNGLWEATLTTRVSLASVLLGKWCALLVFYVLLWLPTLGLIGILSLYVPEGAALDLGPILASYLGVIGIGAALLAVGLAFSTATENQVVAAVGCFSVQLTWLMLGEIEVLGGPLNLRAALSDAARGELRLDAALMVLSVTVLALAGAMAVAVHGRHVRWPGWLRFGLLLVILGSALSLASRHNRSLDLSAARVNSLEPATVRVLESLNETLELTLVRPQEEVFDAVHEELRRLLARMKKRQPLLSIREMDPLADPEQVAGWAYELAIRPEDLASGGAILVRRGELRRSIDLLAMASFSTDDLGVGSLSELRAEAAVRNAIADVTRQRREIVCSSVGHGELQAAASSAGAALGTWAPIVQRLSADGVLLKEIRRIDATALADCDALVVMGPGEALSSDEVLALQAYGGRGGPILIALRSRPLPGDASPPDAGLGLLLEQRGIRHELAAVVDPEAELEMAPAWMTYEGYGDHPIVSDFSGRRATVWQTPWALRPLSEAAQVLVHASDAGWGETDLEPLYAAGVYEKSSSDRDVRSVAIAVQNVNGARLVALGSADVFSALWSERGIGGNERLLMASLHWLLNREAALVSGAEEGKSPERLRLLMSRRQLRRAFVWCVVVGPTFFALLGALLWWWRRREP